MNQSATCSEVKLGLIPNIKPLMDIQMRDTVIRIGGDGMYYLTGSTGEDVWDHNDGVEPGVRPIKRNGITSGWSGVLKRMAPGTGNGAGIARPCARYGCPH